jgi:hypothetical protein
VVESVVSSITVLSFVADVSGGAPRPLAAFQASGGPWEPETRRGRPGPHGAEANRCVGGAVRLGSSAGRSATKRMAWLASADTKVGLALLAPGLFLHR